MVNITKHNIKNGRIFAPVKKRQGLYSVTVRLQHTITESRQTTPHTITESRQTAPHTITESRQTAPHTITESRRTVARATTHVQYILHLNA